MYCVTGFAEPISLVFTKSGDTSCTVMFLNAFSSSWMPTVKLFKYAWLRRRRRKKGINLHKIKRNFHLYFSGWVNREIRHRRNFTARWYIDDSALVSFLHCWYNEMREEGGGCDVHVYHRPQHPLWNVLEAYYFFACYSHIIHFTRQGQKGSWL